MKPENLLALLLACFVAAFVFAYVEPHAIERDDGERAL